MTLNAKGPLWKVYVWHFPPVMWLQSALLRTCSQSGCELVRPIKLSCLWSSLSEILMNWIVWLAFARFKFSLIISENPSVTLKMVTNPSILRLSSLLYPSDICHVCVFISFSSANDTMFEIILPEGIVMIWHRTWSTGYVESCYSQNALWHVIHRISPFLQLNKYNTTMMYVKDMVILITVERKVLKTVWDIMFSHVINLTNNCPATWPNEYLFKRPTTVSPNFLK